MIRKNVLVEFRSRQSCTSLQQSVDLGIHLHIAHKLEEENQSKSSD